MKPMHSIEEDDCLRSCVASILEMNPRRVPHFVKRSQDNWFADLASWLWQRKIFIFVLRIATLADAPSGYWIAIVDNDPVEESSHAIVMRGKRVAFDPAPRTVKRHDYFCGYALVAV